VQRCFACLVGAALVALLVAVPATAAETRLGGVDLSAYCKSVGYSGGAELTGPRNGPNAAYNWHCRSGNQTAPISVLDACRREYGDPRATARAANPDDAYSWTCFTTQRAAPGAPSARLVLDLTVDPGNVTARGVSLDRVLIFREHQGPRALGNAPRGARVAVRCEHGCRSRSFTLHGSRIRIGYLERHPLARGTAFVVRVTRAQPPARGPQWRVSIGSSGLVHVSDKRYVNP
jgi:hypothetical protein